MLDRAIVYSNLLKDSPVLYSIGVRGKSGIMDLPEEGAIAQLVERLLCKQDVDSSNLSGSTIRRVPFWGLAHGRSLFNAANTLSLSKGLYKTN